MFKLLYNEVVCNVVRIVFKKNCAIFILLFSNFLTYIMIRKVFFITKFKKNENVFVMHYVLQRLNTNNLRMTFFKYSKLLHVIFYEYI